MNNLKNAISEKGSQEKASIETGIPLRTLERLLAGDDVKLSHLRKIAAYLDIPVRDAVSLAEPADGFISVN